MSFTLSKENVNLRRPRSTASNGCGTLSHSLAFGLSYVAVLHTRVLTGSVWAGQLLKCTDRSSPTGTERLVTWQQTLAVMQ